MVLDASLLNTQHYKVRIKGKEEQSRKTSCALPNTQAIEMESFRVTRFTTVGQLNLFVLNRNTWKHNYIKKTLEN